MKISIELNTSNDAYHGIHHSIIASDVLAEVRHKVEQGNAEGIVRDENGNVTGTWNLSLDNS